MSRIIDWAKPLSDDDRAWAKDRGMYYQIEQNDLAHGNEVPLSDEQRINRTGVLGTEPSAAADRTEPLDKNPQQTGLHTNQAGEPLDPESGLVRTTAAPAEEGDQYDEMAKEEMRDEDESRNDGRPDEDRILISRTPDDLPTRLREDDAK